MTAPDEHDLLARIRARHQAASPDPWSVEEDPDSWSLHAGAHQILKAPKHGTPYAEYWPDAGNADFLAHAHEDLGVLLERIEDALGRLDFLTGVTEGLTATGHPILAGTVRRSIDAVRRDLTGQPPGPTNHEPSCTSVLTQRTPRHDNGALIGLLGALVDQAADTRAGAGAERRPDTRRRRLLERFHDRGRVARREGTDR